jgi:hypothetical protein
MMPEQHVPNHLCAANSRVGNNRKNRRLYFFSFISRIIQEGVRNGRSLLSIFQLIFEAVTVKEAAGQGGPPANIQGTMFARLL